MPASASVVFIPGLLLMCYSLAVVQHSLNKLSEVATYKSLRTSKTCFNNQ